MDSAASKADSCLTAPANKRPVNKQVTYKLICFAARRSQAAEVFERNFEQLPTFSRVPSRTLQTKIQRRPVKRLEAFAFGVKYPCRRICLLLYTTQESGGQFSAAPTRCYGTDLTAKFHRNRPVRFHFGSGKRKLCTQLAHTARIRRGWAVGQKRTIFESM